MKKIALSLLIALSCISAKAADGKSLFVSFNDGSKIEFALSTLPEVSSTGCCCRGCFFKWHHIPTGRQLTEEEQQYAVAVLMTWIEKQV